MKNLAKPRKTPKEKSMTHPNAVLQSIIDSLDFPIFTVDRNYLYTSFNASHAAVMKSLFGADIRIGKSLLEYHTVNEDRDKARKNIDRALNGEVVIVEEYAGDEALTRHNFEIIHSPVKNATGEIIGAAVVARDLTERKRAVKEQKKAAEEIQDLYDNAPCGYHSLDKNGVFVRINDTELSWLGYTRDEIIGKKKFSDVITAESLEVFNREFPDFKERGSVRDLEFDMVRKDGTIIPVLLSATAITDMSGNYLMSRSTMFDITERKRLEQEFTSMATHDGLTGLPNRILLYDRFKMAAAHAERENKKMAIMMVDLDRFKRINDKLSHDFGDRLLVAVAGRLTDALRKSDTVARMGGDEFVLQLPEIDDKEHAVTVAQKIIQDFSRPFMLQGQKINITVSLGVVIYPDDGKNIDSLIKNADKLMYRAKKDGRNNYKIN